MPQRGLLLRVGFEPTKFNLTTIKVHSDSSVDDKTWTIVSSGFPSFVRYLRRCANLKLYKFPNVLELPWCIVGWSSRRNNAFTRVTPRNHTKGYKIPPQVRPRTHTTSPLNHSGIAADCLGQLLRSPLESNQRISHLLDESLCHLS